MTIAAAPSSSIGTRVPPRPDDAGTRRALGLGWIAALFTGLGLVVVGPWTGRGWLLLLDWTSGPRATLTNSAYGLDPSQMDAMPVRVAMAALRLVVGPGVASWLPFLVFFPVAAAGVARLVQGSTARRVAAAALFTINPFVVQRMLAGQILVLGGYALLPWATRSFLAARSSGRWFRVRSAGWFALMIAVSPHMFWIGGVVLAASLLVPRATWRDLLRATLTVVAALAVYAYGVVMYLAGVHLVRVGSSDLSAFPTAGGPWPSQLANVLTLQGFWRQSVTGSVLTIGLVTGVACAVAAVTVVVGARAGLRQPADRPLTVTVVVAGGVGALLALGGRGPTGFLYRVAFDHVPLFRVMREAQKFTMLVALALAVGFGLGAERLVAGAGGRWGRRALTIGALALVPAVTLPGLAWGLGGDVPLSRYPASWARAERIMGPGDGSVLFLPWHQYQAYPFTDDRTVRNPAAAYFSRTVIDGDALELPGLRTSSTSARSAYLEQLLARGGDIAAFGRLVAPLGVRYVALATTSTDEAYGWLDRQTDLEPVLRAPDLRLWRVRPTGTGRVGTDRVVHDVDDLIDLANTGELGSEAVLPGPDTRPAATSGAVGGLHSDGPVRYSLDAGSPGWVVVPTVANGGWRLDGRRGVPTVSGGLAFRTDGDAHAITYRPWRWVRPGLALSGLALLVLVAIGLFEHRRQIVAGRWRP